MELLLHYIFQLIAQQQVGSMLTVLRCYDGTDHVIIQMCGNPSENIMLDLHSVRQLPNIFGGATIIYTIHECPDELAEWLRGIFPEYTKFRYQTLTRDIPCHVDRGREIAINYLIDAGGTDVSTVWYSDEFGDKLEETIVGVPTHLDYHVVRAIITT